MYKQFKPLNKHGQLVVPEIERMGREAIAGRRIDPFSQPMLQTTFGTVLTPPPPQTNLASFWAQITGKFGTGHSGGYPFQEMEPSNGTLVPLPGGRTDLSLGLSAFEATTNNQHCADLVNGIQYRPIVYLIEATDNSCFFFRGGQSAQLNVIQAGTCSTLELNFLNGILTNIALGAPIIGMFFCVPQSVNQGVPTVLTAQNVTGFYPITSVNFYLNNPNNLIGLGTNNNGTWTYSLATGNLAAGTYTCYAIAIDSQGALGAAVSATFTVM